MNAKNTLQIRTRKNEFFDMVFFLWKFNGKTNLFIKEITLRIFDPHIYFGEIRLHYLLPNKRTGCIQICIWEEEKKRGRYFVYDAVRNNTGNINNNFLVLPTLNNSCPLFSSTPLFLSLLPSFSKFALVRGYYYSIKYMIAIEAIAMPINGTMLFF